MLEKASGGRGVRKHAVQLFSFGWNGLDQQHRSLWRHAASAQGLHCFTWSMGRGQLSLHSQREKAPRRGRRREAGLGSARPHSSPPFGMAEAATCDLLSVL